FFLLSRRPPGSPLFPYTTLFRSGGWLIGLPVTAGPVLLFLALAHGAGFAEHVAVGLVAGVAAQAAFVLGYAAACRHGAGWRLGRSEEHTSELQSRFDLVCRLLLE